MIGTLLRTGTVLLALAAGSPLAAQQTALHQVVYAPAAATLVPISRTTAAKSALRLVNPKTLPLASLMRNNAMPTGASALVAGSIAGGAGDGPRPDAIGSYSPLSIAPYTTAGAYAAFGGPTPSVAAVAVSAYPWRATGKLLFTIDGQYYQCSGSLIGPGILVTAAHCVYEYGTNSAAGWHDNFYFFPGLADDPIYGAYTAASTIIPDIYYSGRDRCEVDGIICNNDIAILVLNPSKGVLPGKRLSWYNYGWNGFSFTTSFGGAWLTHITELGYPAAFDSGLRMERTDGIGAYYGPDKLRNIVLGTAQTGGSSGGPWLANFGTRPDIDPNEANLGRDSLSNTVIAVTSWGYGGGGLNVQGASFFGDNEWAHGHYFDSHGKFRGVGNIGALVRTACNSYYDHC